MATESAQAAIVRDVEFIRLFNEDFSGLRSILNVVEPAKMAAGSNLHIYKSSGTLVTTQVAENAEITVSSYPVTASTVELAIKKYRKQTSIEKIMTMGFDPAVATSDHALIGDIEKQVRADMFTAMTATGTTAATGTTFQAAAANAWAALGNKMDGEGATPVFFCNPTTAAGYLGSAAISLQTAFGMSYIENFLGMGTLIIDANVANSKIIATAQENLVMGYADVSTAEGFEFYTDAQGLVGVYHDPAYKNASLETVAVSAIKLVPAFIDRVIVATISA